MLRADDARCGPGAGNASYRSILPERPTVNVLVKWCAIALGAIVALLALGLGATFVISGVELNHRYTDHVPSLAVRRDSASIARGSHLIQAILPCAECHGEDLGGKVLIDRPLLAVMSAPNLTRAGLGSQLSDSDLAAVIAYLRNAPPATHTLEATRVGPLARPLLVAGSLPLERRLIDTAAARPEPAPGVSAAYGAYLITVASCRHCHGPALSGGPLTDTPNAPPAAKLTPAGIGGWTLANFRAALRDGKRTDGSSLNPIMPVRRYRNMTDDETAAIWMDLKSIPPKPYGAR